MDEAKIDPWEQDINDQLYCTKLDSLAHFCAQSRSKQRLRKIAPLELIRRSERGHETTMVRTPDIMNRTNRAQFKHGITKMVFPKEGALKFKFEPNCSPQSKTIPFTKSLRKISRVSTEEVRGSGEQVYDLLRNKKNIPYHHFTETNSPLSGMRQKNKMEPLEPEKNSKMKMFSRVHAHTRLEQAVGRELSMQRKVFMLQSGAQSPKFIVRGLLKENRKINGKMISEVCLKQENSSGRKLKA